MKKILFSLLILSFALGCSAPLQERVLGIWERTSTCTPEGQCQDTPADKVQKLTLLRPGLAIYENPEDPERQRKIEYELFEKDTKSNSPEILFRFLNLGFQIRYVILKADKDKLELFNPDRNNTEIYKKVGVAPE
ncbi:LIC10301 family lipoprotein [Leptospira semungkisensis]|nr:hypothetical protein [Leptospira semungkisensis]